jgi:hypothetical protein
MPTNNRFTDPVVDDAVSFSDPIVEDNPSSFTDPVVEPDKVDLRTRLRQKDSLLNKIGYVKNRTKKDEPDAEGNTLDDYRRYVNSTDFNKLDDERLGLLANAIDTRHAEVSKKDLSGVSGVARNFGRSLAKGYSRFGTYKAMGNSPSAKLARSMGGAPSEVDDEYARALYEQNKELEETMPTARGGVQDVRSVSDAANYALGGIAENLTSTVDQIGKSVAGGIVAGPVGARAAAAVSGFDQNRGEAISDQIEEGVDKIDFGLANVQALGYSAVDAAFSGAGYVGRKIAGKVAGQTLKDAKKSFIKSISGAALSATKAGLEEAVNEPMQSQVVGRLRRKAQTGSALRDGETVEDAVMEGVNESVGGFISGFAFGGAESAVELKRNKNVMRKADTVIGRLSVDTDISQIQGFDKKLVADYMLGMAVMPDADEKTQADIRSRQSEIMDTVDGNTKTILTAYQSIFTDASFDNVPDTVKPTFDAKKAYASKVEESDGTETYFDETSGIMIQGREGTWSVFNRNGMKMPIAEDGNVKTIQDAVGFAQNLSRLNQWRIENNQSKSSFIQKLAEKNHPGAKVVMIDTPEQAPEGARARMIGGEQGFYNPGDNTVYVMLDAVQNPAQAAIILAHEDTHRGLMEAMKKGGLIGENETVDEAKKRLFGAATSEQAETQEERVARGGEDFTGNLGTLAKLRDTAQVWLSDKTGIKTVLGDADIRLLLDTIGKLGKSSEDGSVEYRPEGQSDANKIRFEDAKNGRLTLAEEFGPEYAEPITGPELMVSEWVRQYNVYKAWKENGAVPDVQVDEYAKRAKYEHEQQKNDLAVFKQKVENGEVIEEGTPVFVNLDSKALESNGVDAEFPVMRVMSSHVTSGKLVYRLMSANGNIVDLYADKVDKRDVSNEVEYDESERDYLGREDAAPGLVAGEVQDDSGKDYDADEQASIEWANGLDEERIKADRQRAGSGQAVGRNDGSLFDEKALPFNLDGGEVEDVVRIAAEKKAEEDRQEAVKRKLDEAPMLPGVDTAVVKESFTPEKATPNVASATSNVALKRGTKVATTRNADGVSYFGEVLQSNPDGTVKIRAFKEKAKGTIAAKTYGVDKAGNRVTKDVDVPAESVKSVDATADTSKLTDEERRKLKMIEKVDAANADNELKAGNQAAAPDVIDKFNDTKERKEKRRTDNGDVMFRRSMAGTPSTADILDTETGLQAARRIVQDYFKPWERQQSKIEKAIKRRLAEDVDVYSAEDKSYGLVRNGVQQFEKNFIEKAEKVLKDNGLTVEEFDQFLMAMAGPTRNKMIADRTDGKNPTGSGQTDAYWNNIISAYRSRGKFAKLKEAAEHVWALNRAVLDMKVSAGLMSKAQADMWKAMSPFYVPLRSDDAEADYNQLGKRATMSLKGKESKSATGRALGHEADTPFAFSVLQALEAVVRANKNIVHETAAKLIEQNPSGLWSIKDRIPTKQSYDADAGKVVSVPDSQFEDAPNVVIVKRDGKKKYLVFEGADGLKLARSLKKESLKHAYAWVSALTRTYAMMRTALVPTFILRNMRADFLQLTINMTAEQKVKMIPQVFKNMKDSWVAVFTYERDGKAKGALATYANEFFSNGGQIAGFGVQSVDKINQGLNRHVKKHGKLMTNFGMPALKFYEYVERGNASIETGTRLALYAAMRKEGKSIRDSIEAGKNITVNFNRKGELGPLVNSVYMFSNVAVQDAARSLKAITGKNGAAVVVGLLGAAFAASMLNNRGDDDDEDKTGAGRYKNIPESEKKRNIIIKIGGKYVKQPIRGIWAWIYYAGTKAGDVAFGKYESYKAALDVAASALDTINILGTSGSVAQFVTPTILDPVVQHIENKSYTGDPMRQQKFTDAQPDSTTGMKRTPGWMKATAKGLNKATGGDEATKGWIDVAPETIKHVIDTLAGGIGTDVSYGVGFASDAVKGDYDVDKTPVVRDVVRDLPDTTRRYYEAKDKFDAGVYAVNHYKTAKERSAYYLENPFMKPSLADRIKTLHKTIKELREKESKTDVKERKATLEARRLRLQSTVLRLMDTDAKK